MGIALNLPGAWKVASQGSDYKKSNIFQLNLEHKKRQNDLPYKHP